MLRVAATNQSGWRARIAAAARLAHVAGLEEAEAGRARARHAGETGAGLAVSAASASRDRRLRARAPAARDRCGSSPASCSSAVEVELRRQRRQGALSRSASAAKTSAVDTATPGLTSTSAERGKVRQRRQHVADAARDQRPCRQAHRHVGAERQRRCAPARRRRGRAATAAPGRAASPRRRSSRRRCPDATGRFFSSVMATGGALCGRMPRAARRARAGRDCRRRAGTSGRVTARSTSKLSFVGRRDRRRGRRSG